MAALYVVSTPIGNLEDITIRAINVLLSSRVIACEDTRRAGLLLQELSKQNKNLDIKANEKRTFIRFDDRSEMNRVPEIIEILQKEQSVSLISDAGTPMLSDPGYLLISECKKRAIRVIPIPGSSAMLSAVVSSGLPANHILFLGFPPEKQASRIKIFTDLLLLQSTINTLKPTVIFYCAPHNLIETLKDLEIIFPTLHIVIARELTKIHETVWTGSIHDALTNASPAKGEIVLLFSL
ncbi:16S rRNA (cytidine(1402)-2'-O)-methyltransferase [Candidatus Gottesmanbacteria bacterium]|nr:16S rRNA (cytidine(1402)-2'-O)-methyltransferase [Candidatus Gottesmanbacteria bacterium]